MANIDSGNPPTLELAGSLPPPLWPLQSFCDGHLVSSFWILVSSILHRDPAFHSPENDGVKVWLESVFLRKRSAPPPAFSMTLGTQPFPSEGWCTA